MRKRVWFRKRLRRGCSGCGVGVCPIWCFKVSSLLLIILSGAIVPLGQLNLLLIVAFVPLAVAVLCVWGKRTSPLSVCQAATGVDLQAVDDVGIMIWFMVILHIMSRCLRWKVPLPLQWWPSSISPWLVPGVGKIAEHSHARLSPPAWATLLTTLAQWTMWMLSASSTVYDMLWVLQTFPPFIGSLHPSPYLPFSRTLLVVESVGACLTKCWLRTVDHKPVEKGFNFSKFKVHVPHFCSSRWSQEGVH